MQVTETLKDGLKRGYTITVTAAELDAKVLEKLVEAQPDIEIKGFRKGKVPMPILRKQFGPRILGDAMQEAIDGAMKEHFEATGDRPALQPDVKMQNGETWAEGQDVVVAMTYEALPAIPEIDPSQVAVDKLVVKADDAAVDEARAELAKSSQDFVARGEGEVSQSGDQVVIDFLGSVDGVPFEGGAADDYPLVLGSGSFIPGFEEQLIGVAAGAAIEVQVTFPAEYQAAHLAGKDALFAGTMHEVKAPVAAEPRPPAPSAGEPEAPINCPGAENCTVAGVDQRGDREKLIRAMEQAGWVKAKAARLLGLTPRQIGYALQKHDVPVRKF